MGNNNNGNNNSNSNCNNTQNSIFGCLFSLDPKQLALFAVIIGILITENLDLDQQNVLGNFFSNIGQSISTIAAQGALLQSDDNKNDNINRQIQFLKKQICALEQEVNN